MLETAVATTPIRALVLFADSGPPPAELVATLRREAIDAAVMPLAAALAGPPPTGAIAVVWAIGAEAYERLIAWSERAVPALGRIAVLADDAAGAAERALAAGFDDVVVRSSPRELAVRVRAVHRRVARAALRPTGPRRLRYRNLVLDPDSCEAWLDGTPVGLTLTELTTLVALLRAQGGVLTRNQLLEQAWGASSFDIGERSVDATILRLRRKLGRPELIETVRGVGFRLAGDDDERDRERERERERERDPGER
ncbi:MAG: winged helix-turn-helix transcriptional regulator [Kofleriaceae bacterium]|jgi:DNA-binding response OmpR family regulator|nr:winged helix-turn-helix transcriptional regulator [Kofleriaceae bacterium]MBP9171159.1 winged helix-turn-helix transcriptional regulator [Kofleriaceae bacterium]MBP9861904.1 winged helix-turn-helix transcriptional regulator [Kofleriaceae bacterium]